MPLPDAYVHEWKAWHDARIADVNHPYGFLSLVSQDWLTEGEFFESDLLPGKWLLSEGEVYYHPDPERSKEGEYLIVEGEPALEPTHIPHRYRAGSQEQRIVPVFFGCLRVETFTRLNLRDEMIHAIRVRDPKHAARMRIEDIETFPLSEDWVIPATFVPGDDCMENSQTVESSIYEASFILGTIATTVNGQGFNLEVHGHSGGSKATGYFMDGYYVVFGDQTNGKESYGGGRLISFSGLDELNSLTQLDFNRAETFPCALTTFTACTMPPAGNRFPFRVTAGEYAPPVPHERIPTYMG